MDVKREKELDERRKNEKLEISDDHPIRKLLSRMRERHGCRILPITMGNDIEKGRHPEMSRTTSTQSIMTTTIDETNPNANTLPPRTPTLFSRRRSPMLRGKTMDETTDGGRSGRFETSLKTGIGNGNGRSSAFDKYPEVSVAIGNV